MAKTLIWLLFIWLFPEPGFTQNLINNGDFERLIACPTFVGDINYAYNWHTGNLTPDLFSACTNGVTNGLNVPSNYVGSQQPISGTCYAGLGLFARRKGFSQKENFDITESIWTKLSEPIRPGRTYKVSLHVAAADSSSFFSNYLTATFSDVPFIEGEPNRNTQIVILPITKHTGSYKWQRIEIVFTVGRTYSHISFGLDRAVFKQKDYNTSINKNVIRNITTGDEMSYYYLDKIELTPVIK